MPTTLSISGGYSKFLEKLEDRLEDAPSAFKEKLGPFADKLDNSIDFLQDKVNANDDLVIGDELGKEIFSKLNDFFPKGDASIALAIDFLKSEPAPSDFPEASDLADTIAPIVFGASEEPGGGGLPAPDLLGLFDGPASDIIDRLFER